MEWCAAAATYRPGTWYSSHLLSANACSCLAPLRATPSEPQTLVHSASPSSKGKSKGQHELDGETYPLPHKREGKLVSQPPHPGVLTCSAPILPSSFPKIRIGSQQLLGSRGVVAESKSPGPQLQKGQAAIFNPSLGGAGIWFLEDGMGRRAGFPGLTDT